MRILDAPCEFSALCASQREPFVFPPRKVEEKGVPGPIRLSMILALALLFWAVFPVLAQTPPRPVQDVTQPGDPILASSPNSPASEGVANAIDGTVAKYLNFDTRISGSPSGFVVSPSVGPTTVIGLALQSANDAPERDPKKVTLEGSNDAQITGFASGTWESIATIADIPAWTLTFPGGSRYQT